MLIHREREMEQVRKWQVLHDEVTGLLSHLKEERMVANHVLVLECLDIRKILLQEKYVFPIQRDRLDCEPPARTLLGAMSDHPMCTLANLIPQGVLVLEERSKPLLLLRILL